MIKLTTPPLFQHQKEGRDFILSNNGIGALFHSMGLGKTRTALEIFSELRKQTPNLKLMVFCPVSLIEAAWGEDIRRFTDFKYVNLRRALQVKKPVPQADIYIINFESFLSKKSDLFIFSAIRSNPFMAVIDESSRMKNHKSGTTKKLLVIRHLFKNRVILSGTPAPNDETEYWAQITFLKDGIFHPKFYGFRNTYFHLERSGEEMPLRGQFIPKTAMMEMMKTGYKFAITPQNRVKLMERMKPICHYANKDTCLDLPEKTDVVRIVEMSDTQRRAYRDMKDHLVVELKNEIVTGEVALKKVMKLRQITSGFLINEDSEAMALDQSDTKLKELLDIIEEAGPQPIIIWCQFQYEIETICNALDRDKCALLYGKTTNKEQEIDDFKSARKRFLIVHPQSGGHGLTFTNCALQIFYSLDYSWERYGQAHERIHRPGQTRKCTNIHLLCENSIDETIWDVLKGKRDKSKILEDVLTS